MIIENKEKPLRFSLLSDLFESGLEELLWNAAACPSIRTKYRPLFSVLPMPAPIMVTKTARKRSISISRCFSETLAIVIGKLGTIMYRCLLMGIMCW